MRLKTFDELLITRCLLLQKTGHCGCFICLRGSGVRRSTRSIDIGFLLDLFSPDRMCALLRRSSGVSPYWMGGSAHHQVEGLTEVITTSPLFEGFSSRVRRSFFQKHALGYDIGGEDVATATSLSYVEPIILCETNKSFWLDGEVSAACAGVIYCLLPFCAGRTIDPRASHAAPERAIN